MSLNYDASKQIEHIAIIMDGNGRWAKKRSLPRTAGHKQGSKVFGDISKYAKSIGIKYFTVYAFSTENWKRPQNEVSYIMNLLREYLKELLTHSNTEGRLNFIGDIGALDDDLKDLIKKAVKACPDSADFTVNIALNYGGRNEISYAFREIALLVKNGELNPENIDEKLISDFLYTKNQPDPDIIIRPGGEKRISNFLPWQGVYSELIFMDTLWPDFTTQDLDKAIEIYHNRQRRYGGI